MLRAGLRAGLRGWQARPAWRTLRAWLATALAGLLVLVALVSPNELLLLRPAAFLRIPVEALVGVALLLVLPARPRRVAAVLGGIAVGLLTIIKILDIGFFSVLSRPFDPVLDWVLFPAAVDFVTKSFGRAGAIAAAVAAVVLAVALLVVMTLSVLRLARLVARHETGATRAVAVLGIAAVACAAFGVRVVPDTPAAALAYDRALQVRAGLYDQRAFASEAAVDVFRDTPGDQLLTALRGKDVVVAFVESYGRDAVEDPNFASRIGPVLDDGSRRLSAAGFGSRSAFLTSPTTGGGSWLAHATLLSGLWINNQQRYRNLVASDRLTLGGAFGRADWRTVGVMPGVTRAWPEGELYDYDQLYDARTIRYAGPELQLGHDAGPVRAVGLRAPGARRPRAGAAHDGDRPGVQPRAVGAGPTAAGLVRAG